MSMKKPVPTSPLPSSPLKPLHITPPSVTFDKRSCNTARSCEHDRLLTRSRPDTPVLPFSVTSNSIERGYAPTDRHDADWQVLKVLNGVTHHTLELVQLKRANFGFRWRNVHEADPPPPSCIMGPHWQLMLITWSVFFLLMSVVNALTFKQATVVEVAAGVFLSGMCLVCYALVGCTNPGIVPRIDTSPDDTYTYCDHCGSYRPEGALHCLECRVCIEEYDHHCPWTGKCVGKGNVRYFYAWLLFLVLAFVYEVIECTTYLLPPDSQENLLDSSDDSLEILFPVVTPAPRL